MKILITADIHNGYPGRIDDCIWSMEAIANYASDHDIRLIYILGDLFHDRFSLNIEMCNKVYEFFENHQDLTWLCFPGNHDMPLKNSWRISSLKSFNKLIKIIGDISLIQVDRHRFWIVPFIYYESVYMKAIQAIEKLHQEGDVLLTHIGVNGAMLNECFLLKNWNLVSFINSKFDIVFSGHFHCHQKVGENLWYPGTPIPFRFDEGSVPHGFIIYDTDDRSVKFIELEEHNGHKPPDFITIPQDEAESFQHARGNNMRILLNDNSLDTEFEDIRNKLIKAGAKSVVACKLKEQEIELNEKVVNKSSNMFPSWLEFDKPKDLNTKLLLKLNSQISSIASERITVEIEAE